MQRASAKICGMLQGMELLNFRRGRHLYSAGRPSCWASAHILVCVVLCVAFSALTPLVWHQDPACKKLSGEMLAGYLSGARSK